MPEQDQDKPQAGSAGEGGTPSNGEVGRAEEAEKFDVAYVKRLREEAAKHRTRVKELEAQIKQHEDEQLSEAERLKKESAAEKVRADKAEKQLRATTVRFEVMLAASRLGCVDPEAAFKLIDQASIAFDDDGNPTNVETVLKELQNARAYLFARQTAPPAPTGSATNPPSNAHAGKLKPEDLAGMPVDEINRRWAEVQETLKAQR